MIEITFLRHGRSLADDERVHEGRYDSPLTAIGEQQANCRGKEWAKNGRHFDLIIASSLQRAERCADIIGAQLSTEIEINDNWMEMDNGSLAGMTFSQADQIHPKSSFVNPYQSYVSSADGESLTELYCRASKALQQVIVKGNGKYLVISHGGTLNAVLNVIMGNQPRANEQRVFFTFSDLSYIDLVYDPNKDRWIFKRFESELTADR